MHVDLAAQFRWLIRLPCLALVDFGAEEKVAASGSFIQLMLALLSRHACHLLVRHDIILIKIADVCGVFFKLFLEGQLSVPCILFILCFVLVLVNGLRLLFGILGAILAKVSPFSFILSLDALYTVLIELVFVLLILPVVAIEGT